MLGLRRKRDVFDACFGAMPAPARGVAAHPTIAASELPQYRYGWETGEKFPGGLGPVNVLFTDYWALRARSSELFSTNLYARGLIRRLVTNEISTGLHLEATPMEKILGREEDSLAEWSEDVETRFKIWAEDPYLCDNDQRLSFGALQQAARIEALVAGDVLVVLRQDQRTKLPRIQLIGGESIQSPLFAQPRGGNRIVHGVELDSQKRHVAFHIRQDDGTSKRLPAFGEKSGRRIAWLLYGTDKRLDEVRGKPLLALVLQSLKEIDRYRDSTQRKAVINSMLAMFVTKTADKHGTRPIAGGAIRKGLDTAVDTTGKGRKFRAAEYTPGVVIDELQVGEKPEAFVTNGTTEHFGVFEEAVITTVAWANEIPPENLRLYFSHNYSASQAANNEFKIYLTKTRTTFGHGFCIPVYQEWIVSQVLTGRINAQGLLEAWRDPQQYDTLGAWLSSDWSGNVKPAVDELKVVNAVEKKLALGLITYDRAARETTGTKFSENVKKMKREAEQLAEARRPIVELEASAKPAPAAPPRRSANGSEPDEDEPDVDQDDEDERKAS